MTDNNTHWMILDEREAKGSIDTWSEFLCVRRTDEPDTCDIAICRYEVVGEIPTAWFDDEGQPLPEYCDVTGSLKLPQFYEYRYAGRVIRTKLTGHDGEYLLGELVFDETYGGPISVVPEQNAAIAESLAAQRFAGKIISALFIDALIQFGLNLYKALIHKLRNLTRPEMTPEKTTSLPRHKVPIISN